MAKRDEDEGTYSVPLICNKARQVEGVKRVQAFEKKKAEYSRGDLFSPPRGLSHAEVKSVAKLAAAYPQAEMRLERDVGFARPPKRAGESSRARGFSFEKNNDAKREVKGK